MCFIQAITMREMLAELEKQDYKTILREKEILEKKCQFLRTEQMKRKRIAERMLDTILENCPYDKKKLMVQFQTTGTFKRI